MSHSQSQKPRHLGLVRDGSKTVQGKLSTNATYTGNKIIDVKKLQEGVCGSAIVIPNHAEQAKTVPNVVAVDRSHHTDNGRQSLQSSDKQLCSHEKCQKKIQDGLNREKGLKQQLEILCKKQKEMEIEISNKKEQIKLLEIKMETQKADLFAQLTNVQSEHSSVKVILSQVESQLSDQMNVIQQLIKDHKEELTRLTREAEQNLQERVTELNLAIADRDHKINKLKSQVADTLKGKSWERQHQIDELSKQLSRLHEDNDLLQMKIKSLSTNQKTECSGCADNRNLVPRLQATVRERDATIQELKQLCCKFEAQLTQQDTLLEQWAHSEGHRILAPK